MKQGLATMRLRFFSLLKETFNYTPIFYLFGNNDSLTEDYGLFTTYKNNKKNKRISTSPYTIALANNWRNGFLSTGRWCYKQNRSPCLVTSNDNDGYYVAYIDKKFRLIALNSVLFVASQNSDVFKQKAQQELTWFAEQMEIAHNNKESVLIALHIPVGNNIFDHEPFWHHAYKQAFVKIVNQYKENIVGILAAHTHVEEFKIIQEQQKKPTQPESGGNGKTNPNNKNMKNTNLMIFTAGLSTSHGNLPGVKNNFLSAYNNTT